MAKYMIVDTMSCKLEYGADLDNYRQMVEAACRQGTFATIPLIGNQQVVVNGKGCSSVIFYDDGVPENAQAPQPPFGRITSMVN